MGWRDLLGLRPRIEDLAELLLRSLSNNGGDNVWTYDRSENLLRSSEGTTINLVNIHQEYANASPAKRGELLDKYISILTLSKTEAPTLWTLAAKDIILAVRSKYEHSILSISHRNESKPFESVTWPFVGDLCLRLLYDFGPGMTHVSTELLATWGQDKDAVRKQALSNLESMQRPEWSRLVAGVYKLVSEVAYEETWMLVEEVVDQLPFGESAVLMPVNRGVLLAADARSETALSAMLQLAFSSLQNNPWPMSGVMLTRVNGQWQEHQAVGIVARRAKSVAAVSLANIYQDQTTALEARFVKAGEDIFVASFSLRQRGDDIAGIYSWCVWTEGVLTLLPKSDVVIFGRGEEEVRESLVVPWEQVVQVCGHYLQPTDEDPPRLRVSEFPTIEEWQQLREVGERLK